MAVHWTNHHLIHLLVLVCHLESYICGNLKFNGERPKSGLPSLQYPVTGSWFKERQNAQGWDSVLDQFTAVGGDTVILRAPAVVTRSADDIRKDPDFRWCISGQTDCLTEAKHDMEMENLNIDAFATYSNEENFSDEMIKCPNLEKKINSSRIYYRLVLPTQNLSFNKTGEFCSFPANTSVVVLFTSFAGTDSQELLIVSAQSRNIQVYFGLPAAPKADIMRGTIDTEIMGVYYEFVTRVLYDHSKRYNVQQKDKIQTPSRFHRIMRNLWMFNSETGNDTLAGYYSTDEIDLAQASDVTVEYPYHYMYIYLSQIVRSFGKKFMISSSVNLDRNRGNFTYSQHVDGFETLLKDGNIDIIAVQEGRGTGKGCYFWPNETDSKIADIDPGLLEILQYLDPGTKTDVTYREQFIGSNNQLFKLLSDSRDAMLAAGENFEMWLNIDAFEYLRGDPCLPLDTRGSGMGQLTQRTTKSRIDWALTVAGIYVNKAVAFAWDPDFTCKSRVRKQSLADEIASDAARPIIMSCGFHSRGNMSVVIIGHGLISELTQAFQVEYQTREGAHMLAKQVYPYYVESDWGLQHNRIASLIYTQLYDVMDPYDISLNGTLTVTSQNVYHKCVAEYDFRNQTV